MRKIIVGPAVAAALVAGGGADAVAETEALSSVEASSDVIYSTDGNDTTGNDTTAANGFDRLG